MLAGALTGPRSRQRGADSDALNRVRRHGRATDSVRDAMNIRPHVKPASKGADEGWAVLSTLMSGFVLFGGIGWALDHWWDTRLMTPIGLIVGMALGIYAVVAQFGRPQTTERAPAAARSSDAAAALRAAKAMNRTRAANNTAANNTAANRVGQAQAAPAHSPNGGRPPASTRRETECL